ncbi:MAG: hypothetical protein ABSF70_00440 [Terracidiphilus sp.]|jgi:hypothetical protein
MAYEDARFPNRKKRNWDQSGRDDIFTDSELQDQDGEKAKEEPQLTLTTYKVIGADPKIPDEKLVEPELPIPGSLSASAEEQKPIDGATTADSGTPIAASTVSPAQASPGKPPAPQPLIPQAWAQRIRVFAESKTRVYVAAAVGGGILFGVILLVALSFTSNSSSPEGRYDLGPAASTAVGLKGRLFIEWDKKIKYRLTLGPDDPDQKAGFAFAVTNSPRPLSIDVHLQDSQGFVLCDREVILKYDAKSAVALAAPTQDLSADARDPSDRSNDQSAQAVDVARLEAQEPARELGKDVFQNQAGPDGQITSINAQGEMPCSAKAYENTTSWSFLPNFPSITEQHEWLKRQKELQAQTAHAANQAAARKKKIVIDPLPFTIEGDDAIVDFDVSGGTIETRGRKTFYYKANGGMVDSRWQDYPVTIHYRCDQSSICTLMHPGAGALRARMRR